MGEDRGDVKWREWGAVRWKRDVNHSKAIFFNFKATDRGFLDLKTNWKFNHLQSQGGDFTTCHGVSLG